MVTMQPPPAYSGDQAPPSYPTPAAQQPAGGAPNQAVYWTFWGVLFGTILTWVFAVSAAADDAWLSVNGVKMVSFEGDCLSEALDDDGDEACSLYTAAKAFQIMGTLIISFVLVVVAVAAFMQAPITGKLGLAAGIVLAVFSVFQLLAFALMAAFADKLDDIFESDFSTVEIKTGPTFGVAVVAWLLGTAGAIVTMVLLRRATTDQDGPFRKCVSNMGGAKAGAPAAAPAGAPAGQPGAPVVGTV